MFQLQPRYIGVEIRNSGARFAKLRKNGKSWTVVALKELFVEDNINLFFKQVKEEAVVSAVSTRDVLMRPCEMQLKKAKDIFAGLAFHVEPLLPYPLEKAIIQGQIISKRKNETLLNVFCIRKDHLSQHLDSLKKYQLEPEIVITRPHAFAALSLLLPQSGHPLLVVHEGEDELSIILIEKGHVLAARSIDYKKDVSIEIQKTFLSFASVFKSKPFEAIYFFGKDQELKNSIQTISGKSVLFPSSSTLALTQEEWIHYGLAIGTALGFNSLSFRQQEFANPHPFKRLKKPLSLYFVLALLLAGCISFFGQLTISKKRQAVEDAYFSLLKTENIEQNRYLAPQTCQEYLSSLQTIEKEIKSRPEYFPLLPQVPKVKELFSWLTSLTKLGGKENATIQIESIHYQMVKRPDFSQKQEHYKVRVDLELNTKDSHAAKAFQDALKGPNSLVDTSEEIQWQSAKGKYRASFYLKDKTKYG